MEYVPRLRLSSAVLAVSLLLGVEAKLTTGQETSSAAPTEPQWTASLDNSAYPAADRSVDLGKLPSNFLQDQRHIFLFPATILKGHYVWPTIAIVGATMALTASDPNTAPTFRNTKNFSGFNHVFSSTNTAVFIVAVPAVVYGWGRLQKDSYAQGTALLAGEAMADAFILSIPFKAATGRKQPLDYQGSGPYSDSFFRGSHNPFHSGGFFSEHAIEAFAVATVIAHRYRLHRWVPFLAYGLAGAITFSRISRSDHFPSDTFAGAALGFVISRYVVLPARN